MKVVKKTVIVLVLTFVLLNFVYAEDAIDYQKAGEAVVGGAGDGDARFLLPPEQVWTDAEKQRGYVVFSDNYLRTFWSNQKPACRTIVDKVSTQLALDEYEPIQIGICATDSSKILNNIKIKVCIDLPFVIRRLEYKEVTPSMPKLKYLGKTKVPFWLPADDTIKTLSANQTGTFWVTFYAGKDAQSGLHKGTITIKVDGYPSKTLPLSVNVLPFVLPKADIPFGLYYYPEASSSIKRNYSEVLRDMAEHGMNSSTLYAFHGPVYNKEGDEVTMKVGDNTAKTEGFPEKYIRSRLKSDMAKSDIPMILMDYKSIATNGGWATDKLSDQQKAAIANFYRDYWQKNDFPEMLAYLRDEPPVEAAPGYIEWAKGWKKTCMRTAAAICLPANAAWGHLHDIWITHTGQVTPELAKEALRQGAEQWTYAFALGSSNALSNRYNTGLYTWSLGLRGNFQWAYNHRTGDNFVDIKEDIIPRVSWEGRREGVDDYRYLQLVEALVAQAGPNPIADQAKNWLTNLKSKVDWEFYHGTTNGDRNSGAFLYPAPEMEIDDYDAIRQKAAEFAMKLGADKLQIPPARLKPKPSKAAKWEAFPFEGKTIDECIIGLNSEEFYIRRAAAAELAERGKDAKPAVEELIELLYDPNVRIVAMRALGAIGNDASQAVEPLSEFIDNQDEYIQVSAVWTLGNIGLPALPALRTALKNQNEAIVDMSGNAISKLGVEAAPAVPELIMVIEKSSDDSTATRGALKALEKIGPKAAPAVGILAKRLDENRARNEYMLRTLAAIGPAAQDAVPVLGKYRMKRRRYTDVILEFTIFKITHDEQCLKNILELLYHPAAFSPYLMGYIPPILDDLGADAASISPGVKKYMETEKGKSFGGKDKKHIESYLEKVKLSNSKKKVRRND